MRLFVCEFVTGGGLYREPLPASLLNEGTLMRDAVLRDFSALAQVQLCTSLDMRLPSPTSAQYPALEQVIHIAYEDDVWQRWQALMTEVDAVLLIAPESAGVLLRLTQMVEQAGKLLLGCYSGAVQVFGDKWLSYLHLRQHQIPTPDTYLAKDWLQGDFYPLFDHQPVQLWIAKPIDGAGGETMWIADTEQMREWLPAHQHSHLVQPCLPGDAASFCMLCSQQRAWIISANRQHLARQPHQLKLTACELNAMLPHLQVFELLAHQIVVSMPDLCGYVGVDVQIYQHQGRLVHQVLDVNPRLTTSYVGLHQAMQINPASCLLNIHRADFAMPMFARQRVMVDTQKGLLCN